MDNNDSCTSACRHARCGDGLRSGSEQCDEGVYNAALPDTCRKNCRLPSCGDGIADSSEGCDDGNRINTDACSNACQGNFGEPCIGDDDCASGVCAEGLCATESVCGNGVRESGEWCDDGNDDEDTCTASCLWALFEPCTTNEECQSSLCTNARCSLAARCGDGVVDPNEECDQGAANSNVIPNRCRLACALAHLGDGVIDRGEECDDGNREDGDGCSETGEREQVAGMPIVMELPGQIDAGAIGNGVLRGGVASPLYPGSSWNGGILRASLLSPPTAAQTNRLNNSGPGVLAIMAGGAAAGFAWVRRRRR